VPKRRSTFSVLPCSRMTTQAVILFLWTSSPQHRGRTTSISTFLWPSPVAAARKASSPTCSLVTESHNSLCLHAAGCKLYRGFKFPVTLRPRRAMPSPFSSKVAALKRPCRTLSKVTWRSAIAHTRNLSRRVTSDGVLTFLVKVTPNSPTSGWRVSRQQLEPDGPQRTKRNLNLKESPVAGDQSYSQAHSLGLEMPRRHSQ
jgi:hypothetical protein